MGLGPLAPARPFSVCKKVDAMTKSRPFTYYLGLVISIVVIAFQGHHYSLTNGFICREIRQDCVCTLEPEDPIARTFTYSESSGAYRGVCDVQPEKRMIMWINSSTTVSSREMGVRGGQRGYSDRQQEESLGVAPTPPLM
ncbi:sarcospan [Clarias magur]|uniref:Sarcospan n=1 Tax=Clarias magur TaxID=1594786 RepID=A0A8J4WZ53_CLAMG|nr:sarcospan [Clarias magur]